MTVVVTKFIATSDLSNTSTALFTSIATGVSGVIKRAVFSNHDTSTPRQITVNVVASAGSPNLANQIINARTLQPGEVYVSPELAGMVLVAGDQVYGKCSTATAVNTTIVGVLVS